ncbi:hypothetical protein KM043_008596 [Ampulex compressa]|nr:hypothetical protein KM043_008596 [Ampulex compressa]
MCTQRAPRTTHITLLRRFLVELAIDLGPGSEVRKRCLGRCVARSPSGKASREGRMPGRWCDGGARYVWDPPVTRFRLISPATIRSRDIPGRVARSLSSAALGTIYVLRISTLGREHAERKVGERSRVFRAAEVRAPVYRVE